jgi:hypothetical protein
MSRLKEEIMVKRTSLVFDNVTLLQLRKSSSVGVEAACKFYGELLAHMHDGDLLPERPFALKSFGGIYRYPFESREIDGKLLREALRTCNRMTAEIAPVGINNVALNMRFFKKGEKEWRFGFQLNFDNDTTEYAGGGAIRNQRGKTGCE